MCMQIADEIYYEPLQKILSPQIPSFILNSTMNLWFHLL